MDESPLIGGAVKSSGLKGVQPNGQMGLRRSIEKSTNVPYLHFVAIQIRGPRTQSLALHVFVSAWVSVFWVCGALSLSDVRYTQYSPTLDDKHLKDVPGTALLTDLEVVHGKQVLVHDANLLKRGSGRHAHIILVPQPSDNPNDP